MNSGEGFGAFQHPAAGYGKSGPSLDLPSGSYHRAPTARRGPGQAPRRGTRPKPPLANVRVRVDDMSGKLGGNTTVLDQVAARFTTAGVDLDIAYGKFAEPELAIDGIIPVVVVSEPITAAESDRWIAVQDAMNLEIFVQPTKLVDELFIQGTGGATRQIIGSTRTIASGGVIANPLHAPVAISAGRLDAMISQAVPHQFAAQVFVNEISITIAHECGHAFGLLISLKGGPDLHPSDPRNVMSRDSFDSLGGLPNLPKTDAEWEKFLAGYKLPEFTATDSKILKKAQKDFRDKVKTKRGLEWKFSASNKSSDRKPNSSHL